MRANQSMRSLPLVLLFLLMLQSGCLYGIAYGPYRDGEAPALVEPNDKEIKADLAQLAPLTRRLRTYGATGAAGRAAVLGASAGFEVTGGVYLNGDSGNDEREIAVAIDMAKNGILKNVVVGNETILSGALTPQQLLSYVRRVRNAVPSSVAVTTAEPWNVWLEHLDLIAPVDFILIHVHPFWEGVRVEDAARYVAQRYREVAAQANGKEVIIGETGWPSSLGPGQRVPGAAVANPENQARFVRDFRDVAAAEELHYFLFSAYDEEWKWGEGLTDDDLTHRLDRNLSGRFIGSSWGIFASDGTLKRPLVGLLLEIPNASRATRVIFDDRGLHTFYDMGVDSSHGQRDWLSWGADGMRMAYPAGEAWGAVFVTIGRPVNAPRPYRDFSRFRILRLELRGERGGESVAIGSKDARDSDNGTEARVLLENLSVDWTRYEIPIEQFTSADLTQLYVVTEFVFAGSEAQAVRFRLIEFVP